MEVIVKGRQKGKTTELIKKSAETGYYILTENRNRAVSIADLAQEMGYKIPFPTTVFEYQRSHGFRGSYIKNIYIDDADAILKSMFSRVIIEAVTMTTQLQDDEVIKDLPSVTPKTRWIPVSERLPEDLEPVNITWVNHNPESYYADIKDKPFTATGVYFNGQWYWWSTLCTDMLAEYSHNYDDIIDDDIEIIAWMPLPEPYKAESEEV